MQPSTTAATASTIKASCRLQVANLSQPLSDLQEEITLALASALDVDAQRIANLVIKATRRLAATSSVLQVSYELHVPTTRVRELLTKITKLVEPESDVSQTFSETLQRSGVEVTSVELLDVPHVYTTVEVPAAEQPNDSRHHEMMLWFFLGVGSSLFAGVAACSMGYMSGVVHVNMRRRQMQRLSESRESSQEFQLDDVVSPISRNREEPDGSPLRSVRSVRSKVSADGRMVSASSTVTSVIKELLL